MRSVIRSLQPLDRLQRTGEQRIVALHPVIQIDGGGPRIVAIGQKAGDSATLLSVEKDEVMDRAYVIELLTIPPVGHKATAFRGKKPTDLWTVH